MKWFSIVMSLLAITLVACGGGGSRKSLGTQCPADPWKPFSMDVAPNQEKISLNPLANKIPPGTYTYEGASLYYADNSGLRITTVDTKQKDNSFKATAGCVRNASKPLNPMNVEGIRDLKVSNDKKYLAEITNFAISSDGNAFKISAVKDPNKKLESPSDAYKTAGDAFLVETKDDKTNYEIRSSGTTPNGTYLLQIRLSRKDN